MDRNGLAIVLLLLVLIPANFCDASSVSNHRKLASDEKDSPPVSTVQSDNKKSGETLASESKKSDRNGPSKENNNKSGSETETQTSKEEDKKVVPNDVSQSDNDKGSDKKIVEEGSKETKSGGSQEKPDPVLGNEPKDDKKVDPKPVEEPKREEPEAGKKRSDPNEKPSPESGKDEGKEKKPETKPGSEAVDPAPPVPKKSPVSEESSDKGATKKKEEKVEKDKKKEEKSDSGTLTSESCDTSSLRCTIQTDLIGCVKSSDDGSKVVIIVQNKGDSNQMAVVSTENTGKGPNYEIPKKQSKLISVPVTSGKTSSIVLLGPGGNCTLPLHEPLPEENYLFRLPTYDKLVTPVNGAYFLIFSAVIFGGTLTCIKLSRRRRQGGGIPYQELEMGIPGTVSTADVETAEGWDESWDDDDWENDSAVKSSATTRISANGLTSRAANKDGWEDNWDD